jgi:hypothetical protein
VNNKTVALAHETYTQISGLLDMLPGFGKLYRDFCLGRNDLPTAQVTEFNAKLVQVVHDIQIILELARLAQESNMTFPQALLDMPIADLLRLDASLGEKDAELECKKIIQLIADEKAYVGVHKNIDNRYIYDGSIWFCFGTHPDHFRVEFHRKDITGCHDKYKRKFQTIADIVANFEHDHKDRILSAFRIIWGVKTSPASLLGDPEQLQKLSAALRKKLSALQPLIEDPQ